MPLLRLFIILSDRWGRTRMKRAFTIIEVLVVLTILITIIGIGYMSVIGIERRAPVTATVDTLIGDLRGQQTQAMAGGSKGTGITFNTTSYTLLPSGAVTLLPANITIAPSGSIYFANGSGDVTGVTAFTVTQTLSGETKTFTVNRYGAVTSIQ